MMRANVGLTDSGQVLRNNMHYQTNSLGLTKSQSIQYDRRKDRGTQDISEAATSHHIGNFMPQAQRAPHQQSPYKQSASSQKTKPGRRLQQLPPHSPNENQEDPKL